MYGEVLTERMKEECLEKGRMIVCDRSEWRTVVNARVMTWFSLPIETVFACLV